MAEAVCPFNQGNIAKVEHFMFSLHMVIINFTELNFAKMLLSLQLVLIGYSAGYKDSDLISNLKKLNHYTHSINAEEVQMFIKLLYKPQW